MRPSVLSYLVLFLLTLTACAPAPTPPPDLEDARDQVVQEITDILEDYATAVGTRDREAIDRFWGDSGGFVGLLRKQITSYRKGRRNHEAAC